MTADEHGGDDREEVRREPPSSNVGKWDGWHASIEAPEPYGASASYRIGAEFLADCEVVEDWGCGKGWFSTFRDSGYVGVDGSASPFADRVVDLEEYTSSVEGIFLRHVLEHNYRWRRILANALASFERKMVLILFTPWSGGGTVEIEFVDRIGVPNLALDEAEVIALLGDLDWELIELDSPETMYGVEHVFLISREGEEETPSGPDDG